MSFITLPNGQSLNKDRIEKVVFFRKTVEKRMVFDEQTHLGHLGNVESFSIKIRLTSMEEEIFSGEDAKVIGRALGLTPTIENS